MICQADAISWEHLGLPAGSAPAVEPDAAQTGTGYQELKRNAIAAFEREYLCELMEQHGGNVTHAARTAGKERRELGKLLKKYGVDPSAFRRGTSSRKSGSSHPEASKLAPAAQQSMAS